MVALKIWIALSPLLSTALGLGGVGPALWKRGVVGTGYASYRGIDAYGDVTSYLGIPYAEPPLGDLRFRAPKPLDVARVSRETGGNIVDATQYPDFCVQGPLTREYLMANPPSDPMFTRTGLGGDRGGAGSEDCLKVNVYTPSKAMAGSNCESEFSILPCRQSAHVACWVASTRVILHSRRRLHLWKPRKFSLRSLGPPEPRSRRCLRLLSFGVFRIPLPPRLHWWGSCG